MYDTYSGIQVIVGLGLVVTSLIPGLGIHLGVDPDANSYADTQDCGSAWDGTSTYQIYSGDYFG
jgi:hypothetical protein